MTGIDATGCNNKIFTVKLYGADNNLVTFCTLGDADTCDGTSISKQVVSDSLTYTFITPILDIASADTVKNVTVVSSDPA